MLKKFESIHQSQTSAFVDGLLCGALIASLAVKAYTSWRDNELRVSDPMKLTEHQFDDLPTK